MTEIEPDNYKEWLARYNQRKVDARGTHERNKMMIRADARSVGMVTAITPGAKGNSQRTGYVGQRLTDSSITGDCVVYCANGDTYTIARGRSRKAPQSKVQKTDLATQYARRLAQQGAIGNVE